MAVAVANQRQIIAQADALGRLGRDSPTSSEIRPGHVPAGSMTARSDRASSHAGRTQQAGHAEQQQTKGGRLSPNAGRGREL